MATVSNSMSAQNNTWHPYITYDALAARTSSRRAELGFRFLEIVTIVAFTALATALIVTAPADSLVLTCTCVLLLTIYLTDAKIIITKLFWENANARGKQKQEANDALLSELKALPSDAPSLRKTVESLGVKTDKLSDQELQKARPAIARAQYWINLSATSSKEDINELNKEETALKIGHKLTNVVVKNASTFKAIDPLKPETSEIYRQLSQREISARNWIQKALLVRIQAAYVLRVIQNPHDLTRTDQFYTPYYIDYKERYFAKAHDDANWNLLIKTTLNKSYTIEECAALSVDKLANQLFGVEVNSSDVD